MPQKGRELLSLKYISQNESEMVKRRALDKRLTTPSIKHWLKNLLGQDKKEDIEDVARFLCLYKWHALFFPHATTIPWVYLARIEDFKKAMSYDWCGAIADDLLTSIKKYHQEPMKVTACVVALQYWLCYHTNIVEANNPDASLGFIRWSLPTMISKFETLSLKDLPDDQVQLTIDDVGEPSAVFLLEIQQVMAQPGLNDSHDWLLKHLFYVVIDEDKKEQQNGRRNEWEKELNDGKEISNFLVDDYIIILRPVMQQCHFYSPFTVENILAGKKEVGANNICPETRKIFFSVLQDKHWMLLVVDCRKRELFWLDSLYPDENTPCAQTLAKWVRQNIKLEKIEDEDRDMTLAASLCQNKLKMTCPLDSPIQNDGYNCGIYMIAFMVSLAVGDDIPRFTKEQANNMRMRISVELQMENLLPPFPGTNYQLLWERKRCDYNKLLIQYERKAAECDRELVQKDFDIEDEAGGAGKVIIKSYTANVTNGTLEIRFYWAEKGTTGIPVRGVYGLLISAISVNNPT